MERSKTRKSIAYLLITFGLVFVMLELSLPAYFIKVSFNERILPIVIITMFLFFIPSFVFLIRTPGEIGRIEEIIGEMIKRHFITVSKKDYL